MSSVTFVGITGHVAGIPPVTFADTAVTFPESPVTLDRNTHSGIDLSEVLGPETGSNAAMRKQMKEAGADE